jgi:translation initiation factor IF-2
MQGKSYSLNHVLTEEEMGEVCLQYNYDFEKKIQVDETNILEHLKIKDEQKDLTKRCPIVTIMGHVDHGKTTLLDTIRKSRIVNSEFGGITQHIGAYQVNHNNNFITFIDTPGHEAFSAMRARGAKVTDIIVLVVAADDGIMPQTKEAILCAKNAKVPVIVFINKVDKPNISVDKVINQLAENNLVSEKWGGETIIVEGSALKNQGIDKLLDAIITLADVLELKANINRDALGVILEANIDKGLGPVATLIVQNGTIKKGDFIVVGGTYGKVRLLINDLGKQVNQAIAGQPAKVVGLNEVPLVGEK